MEQSREESSQAQTLVFGFELEWSQSWGITATPQPNFFLLTLALQNSTSHLCVCVCVFLFLTNLVHNFMSLNVFVVFKMILQWIKMMMCVRCFMM
jgi:hypothetical protein